MFKRKDHRINEERLDRLGREVLRSAALNEAEAKDVSLSPFLYARVRAHIESERKQLEEATGWFNLLVVARRAVPAMTLSAAFAFGVFWFTDVNNQLQPSFDDVFLAANESSIESVVFDNADALSNDEMLDAIMDDGDEQESFR